MLSRWLGMIFLSLCLSGCWMSRGDLLAGQTLSDSGFEGEYTYAFNELNPTRRVSITHTGTGVLSVYEHPAVNYGATTKRMQTLELGQGYFLVSEPMSYSGYAMAYGLVRRGADGSVVRYRTLCEDWVASIPGVGRDGTDRKVCGFRSFTALEAAALSLIRRGSLQPETIYQPVPR